MILSKKDYEMEMENLLKVPNTYEKLSRNPASLYKKQLTKFVKKGSDLGILSKKEATYFISESTKTPVIYQVPKIHKRLKSLQEGLLSVALTPYSPD